MQTKFAGIIVPVITPFNEQERFNPQALQTLVDYLIKEGVHALFPVGSVGEFYALDSDEIKAVIATTILVAAGRVPVIAGTGQVDTRRTVTLSQYAEAAGADGLSILTPFYIQPNEEELYQHYAAILRAVKIPVIGYTNPGRSGGITLSPTLVRRLALEFENFVGLKDSSGSISLLKDYLRSAPAGFSVFTGLDAIIFETVINGGQGGVSGLANFAPRLAVQVYELAKRGEFPAAQAAQAKLEILRSTYSLGTFPAVTKAAANMLGLSVGPTRRPVGPLSQAALERLRELLVEALGAEALKNPNLEWA